MSESRYPTTGARWLRRDRLAGLAVVLVLHGAVFYGVWNARRLAVTEKPATTLFVSFITPPPPQPLRQPSTPQPPKPQQAAAPRPPEPRQQQVVSAPAAVSDVAVPQPPPEPLADAPSPAPVPQPTGPLSLSGELALACPTRPQPSYPAMSRRMGETGRVVVRVELDSDGRVDAAQITSSSRYKRLDEAALHAVKTWRCHPPLREGQPVRAVAEQAFQFNLE
jgi:protein TonB